MNLLAKIWSVGALALTTSAMAPMAHAEAAFALSDDQLAAVQTACAESADACKAEFDALMADFAAANPDLALDEILGNLAAALAEASNGDASLRGVFAVALDAVSSIASAHGFSSLAESITKLASLAKSGSVIDLTAIASGVGETAINTAASPG